MFSENLWLLKCPSVYTEHSRCNVHVLNFQVKDGRSLLEQSVILYKNLLEDPLMNSENPLKIPKKSIIPPTNNWTFEP